MTSKGAFFLCGLSLSFWSLSTLVKYYFQVSITLKVILFDAKIIQNSVTEPGKGNGILVIISYFGNYFQFQVCEWDGILWAVYELR